MIHILAKALQDPDIYQQQIALLHQKLNGRHRLFTTVQEEVAFYSFSLHAAKVSRRLAKLVSTERYQFSPVEPRQIEINNKQRVIYRFCISDQIVQSAIYSILTRYLNNYMPHCVYSYIKGRSAFDAALAFARYTRQHQKTHRGKRRLDLYVLRTDIRQYTDSIPVTNDAKIWMALSQFIKKIDPTYPLPQYILSLLKNALRPLVHTKAGQAYHPIVGIPMGSTLCTLMATLYLHQLDIKFDAIYNGFYARYGDDILLAHPNACELDKQVATMNRHLDGLGLSRNLEKEAYIYFTYAGRPEACYTHFKGRHIVNYVGLSISAEGTLSIKSDQLKLLLLSLRERIHCTLHLLKGLSMETRGRLLCRALRESFQSTHLLSDTNVPHMLLKTNDRNQLKQMDYLIAFDIVRHLTGIHSVKAFRIISYKKIRHVWGLPSLCQLKNTCYKHKSKLCKY